MAIDESGEWWRGTEFADIVTYLKALEPGGYPVDRVIEARCACGGRSFRLNLNRDDELAQTECAECGVVTFVADSEEHWDPAEVERLVCSCESGLYEVGLGLCIRNNEWVRWGSLGARCVACGILGSPVDWKSDLELTDVRATRVASGAPSTSSAT